MKKNNCRNTNIELLRFILLFFICVWHMYVHGFNIKNIGNESITLTNLQLINCSILVPAVNCFLLISGYYGIKFSIEKMIKLIILSFFYFILSLCLKYIIFGQFNSWEIILHIFPISTKYWWFLTEYFTIFMLSPIINNGINNIEKKQFVIILLVLLFINSIGLYLTRNSLGSNLLSLLVLYLLGRYLSIYKINFNKQKSLMLWIGSTIILVMLVLISKSINTKITWLLFSYNNPIVIIQSIGILYLFLSFKEKNNTFFTTLGANSFPIYLFTESLGIKLYNFWASLNKINFLLSIIVILISCLLIVLFNKKVSFIIQFISNISLRKIKYLNH